MPNPDKLTDVVQEAEQAWEERRERDAQVEFPLSSGPFFGAGFRAGFLAARGSDAPPNEDADAMLVEQVWSDEIKVGDRVWLEQNWNVVECVQWTESQGGYFSVSIKDEGGRTWSVSWLSGSPMLRLLSMQPAAAPSPNVRERELERERDEKDRLFLEIREEQVEAESRVTALEAALREMMGSYASLVFQRDPKFSGDPMMWDGPLCARAALDAVPSRPEQTTALRGEKDG